VIAGYDEADPVSAAKPIPDYNRAFRMQTAKLRLGVPRTLFFESLDQEVAKAVEAAIEVLGGLTTSVREITLPPGTVPFDTLYSTIRGVEAYTYDSQWIAESPEKYQTVTRQLIQKSADVKAATYVQARRQVDLLRREVNLLFTAVHLLITPTMPGPPVAIAQGADPIAVSIRNTSPFDILGLPAIPVPCGFTMSGLPIGLQIAGAAFAESTVLGLAHAYEEATEWHRRIPPV
jgi:aspartyl-tRNA(Asn)/glutamyl-tRNA(Gln) amidotransferase subunit A